METFDMVFNDFKIKIKFGKFAIFAIFCTKLTEPIANDNKQFMIFKDSNVLRYAILSKNLSRLRNRLLRSELNCCYESVKNRREKQCNHLKSELLRRKILA